MSLYIDRSWPSVDSSAAGENATTSHPENYFRTDFLKYPPSEYKAKYVPFPCQEREKILSPHATEFKQVSPIVDDYGVKGSEDWHTVYSSEYINFEKGGDPVDGHSSNTELQPAGAPAIETGAQAVRPSFFAWPHPLPPPPPVEQYVRDPEDAISEHRDKFTIPESGELQVNYFHESAYDPNFLGNDISDAKNWNSESHAGSDVVFNSSAPTEAAGAVMKSDGESHPGYFAWLRQYHEEPVGVVLTDDCLVSAEDRAEAIARGDGQESEYTASDVPKEGFRPKAATVVDHLEHLGGGAAECDSSKWESEYDAASRLGKAPVAVKPPPTPEELKDRKPIVPAYPMQRTEESKQAAEAERKLREDMCKIFPDETKWIPDQKTTTTYDASYTWPEETRVHHYSAEDNERDINPDLVTGNDIVSPPYALDTDPKPEQKPWTPPLHGEIHPTTLNLFENLPPPPPPADFVPLEKPFGCDSEKTIADNRGLGERVPSTVPRVNMPDKSEYSTRFSWASTAAQLFNHRPKVVAANHQRHSLPETVDRKEGLSHTLGGNVPPSNDAPIPCDIKHDAMSTSIPPPPPRVITTRPPLKESTVATATASSKAKQKFTVKSPTRKERLWVNGATPPVAQYSTSDKENAITIKKMIDQPTAVIVMNKVKENMKTPPKPEVTPEAAKAYKAQFSGKVSTGNSLLYSLTLRPPQSPSEVSSATNSLMPQFSKSNITVNSGRSTIGSREGFTIAKTDGNVSYKAIQMPPRQQSFTSSTTSGQHLYATNDSISQVTPVIAFPRGPRHVFSKERIQERKEAAREKYMNPILMNKRYPVDTKGADRWTSESHRSFVAHEVN